MKVRKAVIPAAGLGTRFLPATKAIPKEMIPIIDKPMIQYIVEECVNAGIEDIVLVTARGKGAILDHFDYSFEVEETLRARGKEELFLKSRKVSGLCDVLSVRQKEPLGLGHAILCAKKIIGDEPFAVLLGDDLIDAKVPCIKQLMDVAEQRQAPVVGVMEVPRSEVSKYGIVAGDMVAPGLLQVKSMVEKPSPEKAESQWAIPGRYILPPSIFEILEQTVPGAGGEIQLTDGLAQLARRGPFYAKVFEGQRYDTGDKLGYLDATLAYALKRPELAPHLRQLMKSYLYEDAKS